MRMVDSMEASYSMHGHTRSLSSIASTILPIGSDTSTYTSVTASPMEPHDLHTLPIELKVPLPSSSCCSEQDFQAMKMDPDGPKMDHIPGEDQDRHESKGHSFDAHMKEFKKEYVEHVEPDHNQPEDGRPRTSTLEELAELAEVESKQRVRVVSASSESDRLSIVYGLKRRLCSTLKIAYGNLIDQYKSDDQAGFAGLHETLEKLKETCTAQTQMLTANNAAHDTDIIEEVPASDSGLFWIQQLSDSDLKTVLDLLLWVRNDPDFLATRMGMLSPLELGALTSSYHPAGVEFSVLANHSHGTTQMYSRDSQMMKLSRRMDNIQHFHDQDPFFTLMYCVFDTAAKPNTLEYSRRNDVWSSVCARLITDQKTGNEELIIAVADAFMSFEDWDLKPRMEVYLQTVLAEGSFLVDPLANPLLDPSESLESKTADYALRVEEFFKKALSDFFDLIASASYGEALPRTPRDFVKATIGKIQDPQLQGTAKDFLISRWYFASFLSSILVYPELAGLFMTQHIGESARQNILKQIVIRMQLQVFDVLRSKADDILVSLERRVQILAISGHFEPEESENPPRRSNVHDQSVHDINVSQFMLSHQEVAGLIRTLYPNNPLPDDPAQSSSLILSTSAPPSTTSSSTLQPESHEVGSSASSIGPNYSASSINSDVTITGNGPLPLQPRMENVSDRLFIGAAHRLEATLGLDANRMASRLWKVHTQLHAIAKRGIDNTAVDLTERSRWAVFQVDRDGLAALNASSQSSGLLARDDCIQSPPRTSSDYTILKKAITTLLKTPGDRQMPTLDHRRSLTEVQDTLRVFFEDALASSKLSMDFLKVHHWHHCLEVYSRIISEPDGRNIVKDMLADVGMQFKNNIHAFVKEAEAGEGLARSLLLLDRQQRDTILKIEDRRNALRIKMWYLHDVKHSSTYEEALLVTKALRAMASPKRSKQPGSTFSWARQRLRGTQSQERAEAQTLDAITAPKDRGGRRKLADDQVEMTSRWLTRTGVENLCTGEERIHRYCYQVQKSVDRLAGASLLESPVLWSSHLFKREKTAMDARNLKGSHASFKPFNYGGSRISLAPGQYGLPPVSSPVNVGAATIGQSAFIPSIPPAISNTSLTGIPYSSGRLSNLQPSNPGSRVGRRNNMEQLSSKATNAATEGFVQNVKSVLYGLLTSDLGYLLWASGSETDIWINKAALEEHMGEKSTSATVRSSLEVQTGENQQGQVNSSATDGTQGQIQAETQVNGSSFDFTEPYQVLLRRMSTTHDPFIKLEMIWQLETLVIRSIEAGPNAQLDREAFTQNVRSGPQSEPMSRSKSVPRTQATSLEEVIANCIERRAEALRATPPTHRAVSTDAIVNQLFAIFRTSDLRPANLFLSLQYIASFVPLHTLDHTPRGEAFWNCSLAALALKDDLINSTVRRAAEITNAHISTARLASPTYPSQKDAANLWLIAAKEGSPVAARELGLFYLTHPHLLPQRVTKPLSMAKDVFKSARGSDGTGIDDNKGRGGLNPLTFDVVYHWMVIASNGGDAEAKAFLRQSGNG